VKHTKKFSSMNFPGMGLLLLIAVASCDDDSPSTGSTTAQNSGASGGGVAGGGGQEQGGAAGNAGQAADGGQGGASGKGDSNAICDGSSTIRLALFYTDDPLGFPEWEASRNDLGSRFLFVDGHCQFWMDVDPPQEPACASIADYRTGTLEQETAQTLSKVLFYDDPEQLKINCEGGIKDASAFHMWNGKGEFVCLNGFKEPTGIQGIRDKLLEQSVPVEASIRIGVAKNVITSSHPKGDVSWTLERAVENFLIPEEKKHDYGGLTLVSDPGEIAKLRSLRDQWCDLLRPYGYPINPMIVVDRFENSGDVRGTLVVYRQDLPFTDPATGLWSPP